MKRHSSMYLVALFAGTILTLSCASSIQPPPTDNARILQRLNPWASTKHSKVTELVSKPLPSPKKLLPPTDWPDLAADPAAPQGGGENDSAIIIGLEDYPFLNPIPGARKNARDWHAYLVQNRRVPAERVVLLQDREATRERVLKRIQTIQNSTPKSGKIWFIYIGHGAPPTPKSPSGTLALIDAQPDADNIEERGLSQQTLLDALHTSSHDSVVLLDACFTGHTPNGSTFFAGLQPLIPTTSISAPRTTLLTATSANEFAGPLPGLNRPAFSYLILGALQGWGDLNKDQNVTAGEAVMYTQSALTVLLSTRTQTPQIITKTLSTPLSRRATKPPLDLYRLVRKREIGNLPEAP